MSFTEESSKVHSRQLEEKLERAAERLAEARPFAKPQHQGPVLDLARRLLMQPDGIERLYRLAPRLDEAGLFTGTDWEEPSALLPGLVDQTLKNGQPKTVVLECLSELRLLAVAGGGRAHPGVSAEQARHFLTQVLALNLHYLFAAPDEATRVREGSLEAPIAALFRHLSAHIGFTDVLGALVEEIERILAQRPIQVGDVKAMVSQISASLVRDGVDAVGAGTGARRLINALFTPTAASADDPGLETFRTRLTELPPEGLRSEAEQFAAAMHDTGLVSDYHAAFLRWLLENDRAELTAQTLGLSSTGLDVLHCYRELVHRLIGEAIYPETAQSVYGLALLLERGILYSPPIASALWRQISLQPSAQVNATLGSVFSSALAPRVYLLAGVISVLGQPLGIAQGNNPTCQSARALSMWSYSDPGYLLHLLAQAARYDNILMHFEGQPIASTELPAALARFISLDTDPVSMVLVPHLDRVYLQMGRLCNGRGEDPHRWINPELHGWWVGREFAIAVDVATGMLKDYDAFVRQFYNDYHPYYNGDQPVIYPQPAGLAITDSSAEFVGWHAITLIRVALDQNEVMRVYFYNPNNDNSQHWGDGVVVSTVGHGERFGESSLPFAELASRLYIFHDDPVEETNHAPVPDEELHKVMTMAYASWATSRLPSAAD